MPNNNPFSSNYAGASPTQAVAAPVAGKPVALTSAAPDKPASLITEYGFKLSPIPTVSGKPRRVIIRGKVTSD